MRSKNRKPLFFFEGIFLWIYIYATNNSFITGRGSPRGGASVFLALLQACNILFIWCLLNIFYGVALPWAVWISIAVFTCFVICNTLLFEKKLDQIVKKHNALPVKNRLRFKRIMWVYAILSVVSLFAVLILIE